MLAPADLLAPAASLLPTPPERHVAATDASASPKGFPFTTHLSLEPLIDYWHAREQDPNPGIARLALAVRKEVDETTCCRGDLDGIEQLDGTRELVDILMLAVFPPAAATTAGRAGSGSAPTTSAAARTAPTATPGCTSGSRTGPRAPSATAGGAGPRRRATSAADPGSYAAGSAGPGAPVPASPRARR